MRTQTTETVCKTSITALGKNLIKELFIITFMDFQEKLQNDFQEKLQNNSSPALLRCGEMNDNKNQSSDLIVVNIKNNFFLILFVKHLLERSMPGGCWKTTKPTDPFNWIPATKLVVKQVKQIGAEKMPNTKLVFNWSFLKFNNFWALDIVSSPLDIE